MQKTNLYCSVGRKLLNSEKSINTLKRILILMLLVFSCKNLAAQDKGFGFGLFIGEPAAIAGKYWVSDKYAIAGKVGWSFIEGNAIQISADYLYHFNKNENSKFVYYTGIGSNINFGTKSSADIKIGARVPLGVCYMIRSISSDLYFELVPVLEVTPQIRISGSGGIGFRYFFNK